MRKWQAIFSRGKGQPTAWLAYRYWQPRRLVTPQSGGLRPGFAQSFRLIRYIPRFAQFGPGIDPQYAHFAREEPQFLQRILHAGIVRVTLNVGVELGRGKGAELVALQLGHVDAVRGKASHGLVERRRHVAHPEDEGGHHSGVRRWLFHPLFRLSQHDEAGDVALNILDIFLDDVQTIELGREPGGEGRHGTLLLLGHQARRARGIAGDYRFPAVLADEFATLAQRVNVAVHAADFLALHA